MKNDDTPLDPLLEALGETARREAIAEQERFDDRWHRLVRGELSAAEEAALRAEVEAAKDGERQGDYEALRPLGEAFHDRMVLRLLAERQPSGAPGTPAAGKVVSMAERQGTPRRWLPAAAGIAAVLLMALVGVRLGWFDGAGGPLPEYAITMRRGIQEERGSTTASTAVPTFHRDRAFEMAVSTSDPIDGDLRRRYFLQNDAGEVREWGFRFRESPARDAEVVMGTGGEVEPGSWDLVMLYGHADRLPDPLADPEVLDRGQGRGWATLRQPLRVEPGVGGSDPYRPETRLRVEYAGCFAVSPGPVCVPQGETLKLWIQVPVTTALEIQVGGHAVEQLRIEKPGGQLFRVPVAATDGEVRVIADLPEGREAWRLELGTFGPEWLRALLSSAYGGADGARRDMEDRLALATPAEAAFLHSYLARFPGIPEAESTAHLEEAVRLHQKAGQLRQVAEDVSMLAHREMVQQRMESARQRLEGVTLPFYAPAEARFLLLYSRGVLERNTGNYRLAGESLAAAYALAAALELDQQTIAEQAFGLTLQSLGRVDEAAAYFQRSPGTIRDACERASWLNNRAWLVLLSDPASRLGLGDPIQMLAEGLAAAADCPAALRLHLLLNQALALVEEGRGQEAWAALYEADRLESASTLLHRLWRQDIEARLALEDSDGGGPTALSLYQAMEDMATRAFFPEGVWRAKVGQAKALARMGDRPRAIATLHAAETLLDSQSLQVPMHEGRAQFVTQREEGSRLLLALLLQDQRLDEALTVARRSRIRVLKGLLQGHRLDHLSPADQARWQAAHDQYRALRHEIAALAEAEHERAGDAKEGEIRLQRERLQAAARKVLDRAYLLLGSEAPWTPPPLAEGEALLIYHPLPEGWVGFAATAGRIVAHRFAWTPSALDEPQTLAQTLLKPFRAQIEQAARIRVLPYGPVRLVDFHALPWGDGVLLQDRAVVYGLDLDDRDPTRRLPREAPRRALILTNPSGGLPAAEAEGDAVAQGLAAQAGSWRIQRLQQEATAPAVVEGFSQGVDLFHYAGHGSFGGGEGWDSALELARESRLALGDVLALDQPPRWVVLSACEAARSAEARIAGAGLGVAQAFLVAGSDLVVAATRPVGDAAAQRLFAEVYAQWPPDGDLGEALRVAQVAWRRQAPGEDWASFRILVP
jgi:cellulose synthase operon protein C